MTLAEVARYLRYEEPDGSLSPKALAACRKWLAQHGMRPSLKRALYRRDVLESVIARSDAEGRRRRNRGFRTHAKRFKNGDGS